MLASLLLSGGFALGAVGCGEDDPDPDPNGTDPSGDGEVVHGLTAAQRAATLATIGSREITVGELAEELASKGSFLRTRYASPERRREFLDQMIRFELLAQEARRRGYHELPEVERTRKQMMIRRFLEERFAEITPESISDEDVQAFYASHEREFNTPEQVRASHIQVRDRATAQRVLRELMASPQDLRLYRRLAEQHNQDADTRDRVGDLRFRSRPSERTDNEPEVPDAVAEAAFQIQQIGGMHPEVVRSDAGWHIVKLTGRRAAMRRSLEEAERPIRARLHRERREQAIQDLIDELRAAADVEENLDLLSEVQIDLPEGDSPTVTNPQLGAEPSGALRPTAPTGPRPPAPTKQGPTKQGGR